MKLAWRERSLKTLSRSVGVVVHRPKALQNLLHHAAVEEELALVGDDHRVGAGDAVLVETTRTRHLPGAKAELGRP